MTIFRMFLARKDWKYNRVMDKSSAVDRNHRTGWKRDEMASSGNMRITCRRDAATEDDLKKDFVVIERKVLIRNEYIRLLEDVGL